MCTTASRPGHIGPARIWVTASAGIRMTRVIQYSTASPRRPAAADSSVIRPARSAGGRGSPRSTMYGASYTASPLMATPSAAASTARPARRSGRTRRSARPPRRSPRPGPRFPGQARTAACPRCRRGRGGRTRARCSPAPAPGPAGRAHRRAVTRPADRHDRRPRAVPVNRDLGAVPGHHGAGQVLRGHVRSLGRCRCSSSGITPGSDRNSPGQQRLPAGRRERRVGPDRDPPRRSARWAPNTMPSMWAACCAGGTAGSALRAQAGPVMASESSGPPTGRCSDVPPVAAGRLRRSTPTARCGATPRRRARRSSRGRWAAMGLARRGLAPGVSRCPARTPSFDRGGGEREGDQEGPPRTPACRRRSWPARPGRLFKITMMSASMGGMLWQSGDQRPGVPAPPATWSATSSRCRSARSRTSSTRTCGRIQLDSLSYNQVFDPQPSGSRPASPR